MPCNLGAPRRRSWAFRPAAKQEVVFDLPDVLPELEDVASLRWRHSEASSRATHSILDIVEGGRVYQTALLQATL